MRYGYDIEFELSPPEKISKYEINFNGKEKCIVSSEVEKMLSNKVIRIISEKDVKFVSTIFLRPKRDGNYRLILNLRELNQYVVTRHFKMETLKSVLTLVTPNCYFGTLDIKDAYYSIPVSRDSQGWLVFHWQNTFLCLHSAG